MTTPRVSFCLPTWNGEHDLERLLPAIERSRVPGGHEIVAIDSSSSDRTADVLRDAGARLRIIEQSLFRHGATRNALVREARGDVLVFLSQDAAPRDDTTFTRLVAALDDERTAGAFARLLPHDDDDALTARTVMDAPESSSTPRVYDLAAGERPKDGDPRFHNVACAVRASVLRALPFPDVEFGEDEAWARAALESGWRVRYVPEAAVLHAHRYSPKTAFARYKTDAAFHARVNARAVRPNLWSVVKGVAHEVRADWRFVRREKLPLGTLLRSPALRAAQVWGQYVGSRQP